MRARMHSIERALLVAVTALALLPGTAWRIVLAPLNLVGPKAKQPPG